MILGVTGCPGSGKSELASELKRRGWLLIDADAVGREVVEESEDVLAQLCVVFGDDIVNEEGQLNRRELGKRAFSSHVNTRKLNEIVHPRLIEHMRREIHLLHSSGSNVVVDCALIFEWDIGEMFDMTVCVASDEASRKERIMHRDGRSSKEVADMFGTQLSEVEKMKRADIMVKNNGSLNKLFTFGSMLHQLPDLLQEFARD